MKLSLHTAQALIRRYVEYRPGYLLIVVSLISHQGDHDDGYDLDNLISLRRINRCMNLKKSVECTLHSKIQWYFYLFLIACLYSQVVFSINIGGFR